MTTPPGSPGGVVASVRRSPVPMPVAVRVAVRFAVVIDLPAVARRRRAGRACRVIASSVLVAASACAPSDPAFDALVDSRSAGVGTTGPAVPTTTGPAPAAPTRTGPATTGPATTGSATTGPVRVAPTTTGHTGAGTATSPSTPSTGSPTREAAPFPAGRPWRVLVVGDSVAASLAGDRQRELVSVTGAVEFDTAAAANRIWKVEFDVLNVGSVACPVIFDGGWWFSDGSTLPANPVCDRPERYDDELAAFAPDVVLTVFGWPGAGGGQRFSDGTIATPCEARFDSAWEDGYRDLIDRLTLHAVVVVATIAPIAMDARRPESGCLNDIVRRLPALVVDLQDWLCPELDCSARAELRTDGVHFAEDPTLRRTALIGILTEVLGVVAEPPPARS